MFPLLGLVDLVEHEFLKGFVGFKSAQQADVHLAFVVVQDDVLEY